MWWQGHPNTMGSKKAEILIQLHDCGIRISKSCFAYVGCVFSGRRPEGTPLGEAKACSVTCSFFSFSLTVLQELRCYMIRARNSSIFVMPFLASMETLRWRMAIFNTAPDLMSRLSSYKLVLRMRSSLSGEMICVANWLTVASISFLAKSKLCSSNLVNFFSFQLREPVDVLYYHSSKKFWLLPVRSLEL